MPRPKASGAGNQRTPETTGERENNKKRRKKNPDQERGNPGPEGAEQSRKTKRPKEKVWRTRMREAGQPSPT